MELPNFFKQLDATRHVSPPPAPEPEPSHAGSGKKNRRSQTNSEATAERTESAGGPDCGDCACADLVAAANWAFRQTYPEGDLTEDAVARVRAAHASLRPAAAAFKRHGASILRSEEAMRRALARTYQIAEALRDQPATVNALLEQRRIKITKPVRENIFLATLKLVCADVAPDTTSRWAGALAYAAASGCLAEDLPGFLGTTGIREAADRWVEIRRAAKPVSIKPQAKSDVDILRDASLGVSLPDDFSVGSDFFLVIAEHREGGIVGHACVDDQVLVAKAIRNFAQANVQRNGVSQDTPSNT